MAPGQGLEPRPRRSERRVLPLDHPGPNGETNVSSGRSQNDVFQATRLHFGPGSQTLELVGVLRGGALEPDSRSLSGKAHAKARAVFPTLFSAPRRRAIFLPQAGPQFVLGLLQAEHHLWFRTLSSPSNDKGDPFGSPSTGSLCG